MLHFGGSDRGQSARSDERGAALILNFVELPRPRPERRLPRAWNRRCAPPCHGWPAPTRSHVVTQRNARCASASRFFRFMQQLMK
jgi:hypothetical protein